MRSATYQLVQERLGGDLATFVAQRRSQDPQPGWERIAREIEEKTSVYLSHVTLARWFQEEASA